MMQADASTDPDVARRFDERYQRLLLAATGKSSGIAASAITAREILRTLGKSKAAPLAAQTRFSGLRAAAAAPAVVIPGADGMLRVRPVLRVQHVGMFSDARLTGSTRTAAAYSHGYVSFVTVQRIAADRLSVRCSSGTPPSCHRHASRPSDSASKLSEKHTRTASTFE